MYIVRIAMRGLRKLWIAREVSCRSSGNATAKWRILHDKGRFSCTTGLLLIPKRASLLSIAWLYRIENVLHGQGYSYPYPYPYSGSAQKARVGWMGGSYMGPLRATFPSDA